MAPVLGILGMGNSELILVLVIVLLLFGASKLPKLARSMGSSVGEFKKGLKEGSEPDTAAAERKCPSCAAVLPPGVQACAHCGGVQAK